LKISLTIHVDADLRHKVAYVYANYNKIGNLMTADETYKWFYVSARPVRPTDRLGPFRFFPNTVVHPSTISADHTARLLDLI